MKDNPQGGNQSKKLIGKAISFASMGFTAFQVFGHQQKAQAAEQTANEAVTAANEQIAMVDATAAQHIAEVASSVEMFEAQAVERIVNATSSMEVVNSMMSADSLGENVVNVSESANMVDLADVSSEVGEVTSSVLDSFLDWF